MADGDIIPQDSSILSSCHMDHAKILNIGISPDPNEVGVPTNHRVTPDTGVVTDGNVSNDLRAVVDEDALSDFRELSVKTPNHNARLLWSPRPVWPFWRIQMKTKRLKLAQAILAKQAGSGL